MAQNTTRKREMTATLRLSQDERSALKALASAANTSESDVLRTLIRAASGLPLPVADGSKAELLASSEQLRKVGINLNQAVRAMNEGRVGYSGTMLTALQKLSSAVIELRLIIAEMQKRAREGRSRNG